MVVAKFGSLPSAAASSFSVFRASGDESTRAGIAAITKAVKTVMDETNKKAPLNSPALTGTPTTPTAR
nr:phage tail protein [Escherichia coli]